MLPNIFMVGLLVLFPGVVFAYVNPEVGSLLYQGIIGTGLSFALLFRIFSRRTASLFGKKQSDEQKGRNPPVSSSR